MNRYEKFLKTYWLRVKSGLRFEPIYIFRVGSRMLLSSLYKRLGIKKHILIGVEFLITYDCNFRCSHCECAKLRNDTKKLLTVEDYKRLVKECEDLGCVGFCIGGGDL